MSIATMILGEPGTGKTTSLRNLPPEKVLLIQCLPKPLPFKPAEGQPAFMPIVTDNSTQICELIYRAPEQKKAIVVLDDAQYLLANEFMRRSSQKGYDKFTEMARHGWDVVMAACGAHPLLRVYLLWHCQTDDTGTTRVKTVGRMLDEKIFLEGMVTIVLRSMRKDRDYIFRTQTNGSDTCKSPIGLFATEEIPNDLALVDSRIRDYYDIGKKPQTQPQPQSTEQAPA
jgi:hypothetical protein